MFLQSVALTTGQQIVPAEWVAASPLRFGPDGRGQISAIGYQCGSPRVA